MARPGVGGQDMRHRLAIVIGAGLFGAFVVFGSVQGRAQQADSAEVTFWNSIKDSKSAAEYKAYLSRFPNGTFADLAKLRVKTLEAPAIPAPVAAAPAAKLPSAGASVAPAPQAAVAAPPPPAAPKWGAIAFAANGANAGQWNHSTKALAEEAAVAGCRRVSNSASCDVASTFGPACIALAFYRGQRNGKNYAGTYWASRGSLAEATTKALDMCRERSPVPSTCGIRTFICADGSHKKA